MYVQRTIESFITWCNDSYLNLNIWKTNELVVNYNASNMDVFAKKLQNQKLGVFSHRFSLTAQKISTVLRWAPQISVTIEGFEQN